MTTTSTGRTHGPRTHELRAQDLTLGYAETDVVSHLDVEIPPGRITVIVGANACGKSTLLRGLARLLKPRHGTVLLDGTSVHEQRSTDVARIVGLLPQTPVAPDGITVADLVGRGRYPHQGWFRRWSPEDDAAVAEALEATGTADLADRPITGLSGGQRQRVWVAMALAQDTDLLLLDEPTTYLDINHQVELLDLLTDAAVVEDVFGLACQVVPDPVSGTPLVVPRSRHHVGGLTSEAESPAAV
jgi:iron complex transport system ATP-binding protein